MSDYRYQPLTDQWIVIAGNREQRPNEYRQDLRHVSDRPCPFCLGQESQTPEAVSTYPGYPNLDGWQVRVFPNKYPALTSTPGESEQHAGPYRHFRGFGVHELIVLSPRHVESFAELHDSECELSLFAFQDRLRNAYSLDDVQHAIVFQNCRVDAGASIQHVHCQLIGTAIVPTDIARRMAIHSAHLTKHNRSLLQDLVTHERSARTRLVAEAEELVTFCPFASRLPYETWIAPTHPDEAGSFLDLSEARLSSVARRLQDAVVRLERCLPGAAYNFVVHIPPQGTLEQDDRGSWFIEVFPRVNKIAAFEWATGCMINQVAPELAAERLRDN